MDEDNVFESAFGRGRVEVLTEGTTVSMRWFHQREHHERGIEMVRFRAHDELLSIYPKIGSGDGFAEQYGQVREIQIDTTAWPWSPESSVGENDRGHVELFGLPNGFMRIFDYGLGFPRPYRGLIRTVEDKTNCTVVRFGNGYEGEKDEVFHISLDRFQRYTHAVDLHKERASKVVSRINENVSHNEIADIIGDPKKDLILGRLGVIRAMTRAISDSTPLDATERSALVERFDAESKQIATEQPKSFGKLREGLELVTLEVLIDKFEENLTGKGAKSEDAWQQFFKDNTFALKQIFAAPVALYGEQLNVRITDMKGAGGQIVDFVLANTLTNTMIVVEIKTPAAALMTKKTYRGASSGGVHAPHNDLSGAVAQLQAQMASARTDFEQIISRTPAAGAIDTKVVMGAVIAGTLASMNQLQKESFVRYRNGLHGIEVITFDEVLDRLRELLKMLQANQTRLPQQPRS